MSARISRTCVKIGRVLREEALGRLRVAEDGGERLVQFVRQRAGELAEHGHAREMREFAAPFVQLLFRLLARRDVKGDAAHVNRFATAVALDAATGGDPTHPAIRENDPILLFVTPAGLLRLPQGLADRVAIS